MTFPTMGVDLESERADDNLTIKYVPGEKMANFIKEEVAAMGGEGDIPETILAFASGKGKSVLQPDLRWMKKRLSLQGRYLHQIIPGTEELLPTLPRVPRNPELEARCQKLRREQEEREYRAMTKMVDPKRYREPEESIAYQMKQINRQLIAVLQFVFSVAAGFMFGYLGLELIFGGLDMRVRLLSGVGCALVIAVAEIYFLIMHLMAEDSLLSTVASEPGKTSEVASIPVQAKSEQAAPLQEKIHQD